MNKSTQAKYKWFRNSMSNSILIIKTSYDHLATIYTDKLHTYMHVLGLFTILYGKSGSDVQDVMVVLSQILLV